MSPEHRAEVDVLHAKLQVESPHLLEYRVVYGPDLDGGTLELGS